MKLVDQHGPSYPGDLVVSMHSLVYYDVKFHCKTPYGTLDVPGKYTSIVQDEIDVVAIEISSVKGEGTWKFVVTPYAIGWIPWSSVTNL